ncbi:hypothetical protein [Paenibacillus antarcticus]|nr:hypothetical protein [Paenibacillus antarcticus]
MTYGVAILTISTIAFSGVITSNAQGSSVENSEVEVGSFDPSHTTGERLPAVLLEDSNHPDFIQTQGGLFAKKNQFEANYSQDEIVTDATKTTEKTKVIIQNGDIFIKEEDVK